MSLDFEIGVISLLRDEYLQSLFLPCMDSGLIVEETAKILFNAIKTARTSDISVLSVTLAQTVSNKSIVDNLVKELKKIDVPIIKPSAIVQSISLLESYVRWRKTATQVAYMASQNFLDSVSPQAGDKLNYEKLIEACTFAVAATDESSTYNFSKEEDYLRAKESSMPDSEPIRSRFKLLNDSFQYYGYTQGTVNAILAPPGVGKSTFMVSEAVNFIGLGKKILHYVLGDLDGYDICHKYIANSLKVSLNDISRNSDMYYNKPGVKGMFENVTHRIKGAYELDVDELAVDAMRWKENFDYDVLIIDYDGNIKPSNKDNLYTDGGHTYGTLEKLARRTGSILLVGCQPKPDYWGKDILPLQSPNDSSKKQFCIDTLVTMSKPNTNIPLGIMHLPKVRRGVTGNKMNICYLNEFASILEVDESEKDSIAKACSQVDVPAFAVKEWALENREFYGSC
jgi:hypothetical protein